MLVASIVRNVAITSVALGFLLVWHFRKSRYPRLRLGRCVFLYCFSSATFILGLSLWMSQGLCDRELAEQLVPWRLPDGRKTVRFIKPTVKAIEEWRNSVIAADMIEANLVSVPDVTCWGNLFALSFPILDLLDWNRSDVIKWYKPLKEREAWTYVGHDPHTLRDKEWFELKPLPPVRAGTRKYETTGNRPRIGLLRVPRARGEEIAGLKFGEESENPSVSFWRHVMNSELPIIVTEGEKKAASLISAGLVAVSLPGAHRGLVCSPTHRGWGTLRLSDDLKPFLRRRRTVFISFDHDEAQPVREFVYTSAIDLGLLLEKEGAAVRVIELPGPEKGVDDFILARGTQSYRALLNEAPTLAAWQQRYWFLKDRKYKWCAHPCNGPCVLDRNFPWDAPWGGGQWVKVDAQ